MPHKIENVNMKVFNMIKQINESKALVNMLPVNTDLNLMAENIV